MSTEPGATAAPGGCPITADFLPPNMRKHVDPAAPVPLRMMGAKALVPLSPADMLGALYMLTFDADPGVRDTAAKTAASLSDRFSPGLRDEHVQPPVLGYFLDVLHEKETYVEMLVLNANTPDDAVARVARKCGQKIAELIGQNQLRVLRHDDIVRGLCANPHVNASLIDSVCDFAVRSGLQLTDVPQMQAARVRLFGPQAIAAPPDPGPTAEQLLQEFGDVIAKERGSKADGETEAPMEEGKRMTITQRIMKMSIAEKIKLATLGNKEVRSLLIRETNKLVCTAVIRSPRITDGEVLAAAANRAMNDEVLRVIYNNREWMKNYKIKLTLVKNPKVPLGITMKILSTLRENDIKDLSRDKNVPSGIQTMAKRHMDKKNEPKKEAK